jgi:S-adenosylmethionine hydrolase
VVAVASGASLSFLAAEGVPIRAVKVADAGSQFRSRDVFPAAVAALARGDDLLGAELRMPPPPARSVVYTDGYGNLKTSWTEPPAAPGTGVRVKIGDREAQAVVSDGVFGVPAGTMSFAPGSSGWGRPFYELLIRGGSAADTFGRPAAGTPVEIF